MNDFPLISILVPAYNHEHYIALTLKSILEDNYPNKEVAIINDGSSDNTGNIIEQWVEANQDKIAIKYKTRANCGVTKTLNDLVDLSNGEYVLFIHSDDYLLQNGIRKRYEYLRDNPGKQAVFSDCIVIDENDNILHNSGLAELHKAKKENYATDDGLKLEIINRWSVPGGTLMAKKEIYKTFRYNENFTIEDLDFYLYFASKNLIGFLNEKVSAYRVHGKNTCMTDENWIKVQNDMINSLKNNFYHFNLRYKIMISMKLIILSKPLVKHRIMQIFR